MGNTSGAVFAILIMLQFAQAGTPPSFTSGPLHSAKETSVLIYWTTDIQSTTEVKYGLTASLELPAASNTTDANTAVHYLTITGLSPSTQYYYNATSCSDRNCTTSGGWQFTTLAPTPFIPAPVISAVTANATNDTAFITWATDINSNSGVFFGTAADYGNNTMLPDNTTTHLITIVSLQPSTAYYYLAQSCNGSNCTNSTGQAFTTLANPSPSPSPSPSPTPSPSPGVTAPPSTCIDTDGGRDFFVKGTIISGNEGGDDVCESSAILKEYLCNEERTFGSSVRYNCPNGCRDGRCLLAAEANSANATPSPSPTASLPPTNERKVGFRTKVSARFGDSSSTFSYSHSFDSDFAGEASIVLPFDIKDYNSGSVELSPKPTIAKNDGSGMLEAIYADLELEGGEELEITITLGYEVDASVLEKFVSPILTETGKLGNGKGAELQAANASNADKTAGSITGLVTGGQGGSADAGWLTAAIQIALLVIGVGVVHYYEKDVDRINAEQASAILEDLEKNSWRKRR